MKVFAQYCLCSAQGHFACQSFLPCKISIAMERDSSSQTAAMAEIGYHFSWQSGCQWAFQRNQGSLYHSDPSFAIEEALRASSASFGKRSESAMTAALVCSFDFKKRFTIGGLTGFTVGNFEYLEFLRPGNNFVTNNGNYI